MTSEEHQSERGDKPGLMCPKCDRPTMRRMHRHGFMQRKIYPLFGYYPWECGICRFTKMFQNRGPRRRRRRHGDRSESPASQD